VCSSSSLGSCCGEARNILIGRVVFDYIPFPVLTHTTGMTYFQNFQNEVKRIR